MSFFNNLTHSPLASPQGVQVASSRVRAWLSGLLVAAAVVAPGWVGATTIQTYGGNLIPTGLATNVGQGASGIAVDSTGRVYVADSSNHAIRRIDPATGISTVIAGTGTSGFSGDGGPATQAKLNSPKGVALDSSDNIYIADTSNHRIRKIDAATGNISTIAGTGSATFGGDTAAATAARVNSPQGVAVDSSGNVFIADTSNNRIRKITASTGNITTVAGNGTGGYLSDNVSATGTRINAPRGVVVDSAGNFFIADTSNNRIRKVSSGGTITTFAGTGSASFSGDNGAATSAAIRAPQALTLDSSGNLYIADTTNHRIRKVSSGIITSLSGIGSAGYGGDNGPATSGQLSSPAGIAVNSSGTIYIGDTGNLRVRKISGGTITTFAGTGSATFGGDGGLITDAQFTTPQAIVFDSAGNRYISDSGTHRIRKVTPNGVITTIVGTGTAGYSGDNGPAISAKLNTPLGIGLDAASNLYIADGNNNRIRKVDLNTGIITTVVGTGSGGFSGDNGAATSAQIFGPFAVIVDSAGNLYLSDTGNNRIRKVNTSGTITTFAGTGGSGFSGDGGAATSAQLNTPIGLAFDSAENLYVTDYSNGSIRKISGGIITTVAGNGANGYGGDNGPATSAQLNSPRGVAVDAAGNIFIADTSNSRIRKVATNGVITTIVGTGSSGFSGDLGPAVNAQVSTPQAITVIGTTGLLIGDTGNRRYRLLTYADAPGTPTSIAASADDASVNVFFVAPVSTGGANITKYTVTCTSSNGGTTGSATGTASPITVSGLTNGKNYTCTVTATNAAPLNSAVSTASNIVTPNPAAAAATNDLTAPTIDNLPTLPGINSELSVLNLNGGNAPVMVNCLMTLMSQNFGGRPDFQGQSATGGATIALNGQVIAFYPLSAANGGRLDAGFYLQSANAMTVATGCGTFNAAPAIYDLAGAGALVNSMGASMVVNGQGVITALLNGTYYVVRPDYVVTPGAAAGPSLTTGADGLIRYTDSNGNSQILRPAFLDPNALLSLLNAALGTVPVVIQKDGTAMLIYAGHQYLLTPDLTLSPIPDAHAKDYLWQDGPNHYSLRIMFNPHFDSYTQGFTAVPIN